MKQFILMADVIESRTKESISLMKELKKIVSATNRKFKKLLKSPLTITLGDEFQGVIVDLTTTLDIIIYIEEEFIHSKNDFKLRYVLIEGKIDTLINNKIAFEMLGPGLTEAREKITQLKETNQRFFVKLSNKSISELLNNSFLIFQNLISHWKIQKDYDIVSNFIKYHDYKKVSEIMKKNRSLIWKRERTLHIESYRAIKNILYTTVKLKSK